LLHLWLLARGGGGLVAGLLAFRGLARGLRGGGGLLRALAGCRGRALVVLVVVLVFVLVLLLVFLAHRHRHLEGGAGAAHFAALALQDAQQLGLRARPGVVGGEGVGRRALRLRLLHRALALGVAGAQERRP